MLYQSTQQICDNIEDNLEQVFLDGERIVLQRNGQPVAAIVSIDDLEYLQQLEDESDLAAAQEALAEPGMVAWDTVKAEFGL